MDIIRGKEKKQFHSLREADMVVPRGREVYPRHSCAKATE